MLTKLLSVKYAKALYLDHILQRTLPGALCDVKLHGSRGAAAQRDTDILIKVFNDSLEPVLNEMVLYVRISSKNMLEHKHRFEISIRPLVFQAVYHVLKFI